MAVALAVGTTVPLVPTTTPLSRARDDATSPDAAEEAAAEATATSRAGRSRGRPERRARECYGRRGAGAQQGSHLAVDGDTSDLLLLPPGTCRWGSS